jgi:ABC-type oligopeptide transport system substrate-binding subunit
VKLRLTLFFLLALGLVGCTRLFGPSATLTVAIPQEPVTLDWAQAKDPASAMVLAQLQRGLLKLESVSQPIADLAQGWSVDLGGTVHTFVLSPERWSDGVELRAEDFLFGWKRILEPSEPDSPSQRTLLKIAGARAYHEGKVKAFSAVKVRAVSPTVLEVVLEKKDSTFTTELCNPSLGPQREDVYEMHPHDFTAPLHLRTIGAYQILDWKKGESLLLVTNSYSSIQPAVGKVSLQFLDETRAKPLFDRGQIEVLSPAPGTLQYVHGAKIVGVPLDAIGQPLFSQVQWK